MKVSKIYQVEARIDDVTPYFIADDGAYKITVQWQGGADTLFFEIEGSSGFFTVPNFGNTHQQQLLLNSDDVNLPLRFRGRLFVTGALVADVAKIRFYKMEEEN